VYSWFSALFEGLTTKSLPEVTGAFRLDIAANEPVVEDTVTVLAQPLFETVYAGSVKPVAALLAAPD